MDAYDDGYVTQHSYPQYGRVLIDGSGRVISDGVIPQPVRILHAPRQQPEADRPRTQPTQVA